MHMPLFTQIFSKYGVVLKIITFTKNGKFYQNEFISMSFSFLSIVYILDKFQGLIQMKDATTAQAAKLVN